jgi:hypothetical protein
LVTSLNCWRIKTKETIEEEKISGVKIGNFVLKEGKNWTKEKKRRAVEIMVRSPKGWVRNPSLLGVKSRVEREYKRTKTKIGKSTEVFTQVNFLVDKVLTMTRRERKREKTTKTICLSASTESAGKGRAKRGRRKRKRVTVIWASLLIMGR